MYCVRCGRKAAEGEKRCAVCNMRLVSPAKLNRLLNEEKERNDDDAFDRFLISAEKTLHSCGKHISSGSKKLAEAAKEKLTLLLPKLQEAWEKARVFLKKEYKVLRKKYRRLVKNIKAQIASFREEKQSAGGRTEPVLREKKPAAKSARGVKTPSSSAKGSAAKAVSYEERPATRGEIVARSIQNRPRSVSARHDDPFALPTRPASGVRKKTPAGKPSSAKHRTRAEEEFEEKNVRFIVSMGCLLLAFILLLMWGTLTPGGKRTFAGLGMGSAGGYVLLGDDCMAEGNYSRAVEHYYKALSKKITYDAAYKLAAAYSHTGDLGREVSALLLCVDYYPKNIEPYKELLYLYPEGYERPEKVSLALGKGLNRFGDKLYEP